MNQGTYSAYDREGRRKYLTLSEGKQFLKTSRKLPQAESLFCQTVYYTGMRISEALALSADDVDQSTGTLRVRSLKKRQKREFRRIPVPKALATGLIQLISDEREGCLWNFSRPTAWRTIKRVMAECQIVGIHATAKGLRHGFGVRCALAKIPLNLIQLWFGHSQPSTLMSATMKSGC